MYHKTRYGLAIQCAMFYGVSVLLFLLTINVYARDYYYECKGQYIKKVPPKIAIITEANLCMADLRGADLRGADLRGADLSEANLSKATLLGANLSKVDLSKTDLSEADLRGANLLGADLSEADLSNADLSNADLSKANLSEAYLVGANLSNATLKKTNLIRANFSFAILRKTLSYESNFDETSFVEADLSESSFQYSRIKRSNLERANLSRAFMLRMNMQTANLKKANFGGTNLVDTNLEEADLRGADLTVSSLTGTSLKVATIDKKTKLPSAIDMAEAIGLDELIISDSAPGLVKISKELYDMGYKQQAKNITAAINRHQQEALFNHETKYNISMYLLASVEYAFDKVFFDFPTNWGANPSRALMTVIILIFIFSVPYTIVSAYPFKKAGIWRKWGENSIAINNSETPRPDRERLYRRWYRAILVGIYFSLIAATRVGWRELTIGSWLERMQLREYSLYATGYARFIAGVQSLISVYLIAMWALTYFGMPFA